MTKAFEARKKNVENMSVEELEELISTLKAQVQTAEQLLQKKILQKNTGIKSPVGLNQEKEFLHKVLEIRSDALDHVVISCRDTRRHLKWDKKTFDDFIMKLAYEDKITLHHHDHPQGLKPEDRDQLVLDKHGNYYIGFVFEADYWKKLL